MVKKDGGLLVSITAYEPNMADVAAPKRQSDDTSIWMDNSIELMVDPTGSRQESMHFMVNSSGSWADLLHLKDVDGNWKADAKWSSGAKVEVESFADRWICRIAIPDSVFRDGLPRKFPAELFRNRLLKGENSKAKDCYIWGPYASGPCDFDNFGTWEVR